MIYPTDVLPEQAKDVNLHLIASFNQVVNLALHRHSHAVHAFHQLEDPTEGWPLRGLVSLIGSRFLLRRSALTSPTLRHRIHQERERHHPQHPLHPTGFFDKQRRDKAQRVLEESASALGMAWRCGGPEDCPIAHVTRGTMGADDRASAVVRVGLEDGRLDADLGLPWPCSRLDRAAGRWSPFPRRALVCDEIGGATDDSARTCATPPAPWLARRQESCAALLQVKEVFLDRFAFPLLRFVDALFRAFDGRLRRHH